jgi:hypothetical protein
VIRVEVEVCFSCLGPVTGGDPECPVCAIGFEGNGTPDPILLRVTGRGGWSPGDPGRTYGPPEDCYPPTGGEWDGDVQSVVRSDTGYHVPWRELPCPTQMLIESEMAEAAETAYAEDDSAECADEDAWDARNDR